jgi:gamma-glutamylcyclotransferase (GGCT)/AIG2-like uncharacterized protein YtfP
MMDKNKYLPVFVYGTLMEGFGNHSHFLHNNFDRKEEAILQGHVMMSLGGFPMIFESPSKSERDVIIGEVYWIPKSRYLDVMGRLDSLEGEGYFYHRDIVMVTVQSNSEKKEIEAWAYRGHSDRQIKNIVVSGSWREHVASSKRTF